MTSGVYRVSESGTEFVNQREPDAPTTPEKFLEKFRDNFEMRVLEERENELVMEFIHVDVSFMNALRRILLAEVPTVAIEHVFIFENSGIMKDEILSHRLGLIPIKVDARLLQEAPEDTDDATDLNTIVLKLDVSCPNAPSKSSKGRPHQKSDSMVSDDELEKVAHDVALKSKPIMPEERPFTKHIYSSDLEWSPAGDQLEFLEKVKVVHDDILITKLRPGQKIDLEAHAVKGIGKDHAKFSPVATASYRLMPKVEILKDVYDELAEKLVHVYEPGVFELIPTDPSVDPAGTRVKVRVDNPYACTMSRNYMREDGLKDAIRIERIPDHFIFSIESVGVYPPAVLLAEALRILQQKCQRVYDLADNSN